MSKNKKGDIHFELGEEGGCALIIFALFAGIALCIWVSNPC